MVVREEQLRTAASVVIEKKTDIMTITTVKVIKVNDLLLFSLTIIITSFIPRIQEQGQGSSFFPHGLSLSRMKT
ncbi:MAG: hypothetical protein K8R11_01615 [Methanococcoides sp.]|nr:hypothetical protein [Methanococcoides sp.]